MERATGFEPALAVRRLLGRPSPSSSRPSPHEAGHVAPNAEAFGTGVSRPLRAAGATRGQPTTLARRCFTAARSSASELLKSRTSRCAAAPNGVAGKTKSPVGLRTHRAGTQWFSGSGLTVLHPFPVCARDSSQAGQNASAPVQERTPNRCSPRRNTAARLGLLWPAVSYRF